VPNGCIRLGELRPLPTWESRVNFSAAEAGRCVSSPSSFPKAKGFARRDLPVRIASTSNRSLVFRSPALVVFSDDS
jgi:hypothetical protein